MKENTFDTIIIGAGPIGLASAIECIKNNLSYLIVEKGCLVNSLFRYPKNMTFFSTSEKLEIGNVPFVSISDKPTRSEALEYYRRVAEHWKLEVSLYNPVINVVRTTTNYRVETKKGSFHSKSIIIATGFYDIPNKLNVEGEELPKVHHYYNEPHPYAKQNVLVVGAANSAVDVALETWRKGANVTMIIKASEFSSRVKYWVKPDIENRIKEGSIKAYFESKVEKITETQVIIRDSSGRIIEIENDFVFAMTGYLPDFSFLKKIGITMDSEEHTIPCHNKTTYETNLPGVFLAGVVCGGSQTSKWFIENSRSHAKTIVQQLIESKTL